MPVAGFLERFEHKKEDVKYRLNAIVDDLFVYLAVELSRLAVPPDRANSLLLASEHHHPPLQHHHQQQRQSPPVDKSVSQTAVAKLSLVPQNIRPPTIKEELDGTRCDPIPPQRVLNSHAVTHEPPGSTSNEFGNSPGKCNVPPVDAQMPSTSTASSVSASIIQLDDEIDEEDDHSDSDCDCEQCMGVPICKVDIDDDHEEIDRPAKKQKTTVSNNDNSVANYHDGDDGEQCSATFKTLSIKCSQDDCPSMFKNKIERNQHLLYVHGILPYTCLMNGCKQGFDNVRQYGEHVNVEHKDVSTWPCNKCPKVCTDHRLLCRHIYFYHQEGRFKCRKSKCNFVAPYRIDVRKHSQLHTEMYACQFGCGKSFSHTHHRKRHERIHLRLKPFRCKWPNCGYCSEARSTVIRHIRIRHFNLPLTLKQQNELNIVDNRNPRDYMEILTELMN